MIAVYQHACPQNHACPAVLHRPVGALIQEDIFSAPPIDRELCTECGACSQICCSFYWISDKVGVV